MCSRLGHLAHRTAMQHPLLKWRKRSLQVEIRANVEQKLIDRKNSKYRDLSCTNDSSVSMVIHPFRGNKSTNTAENTSKSGESFDITPRKDERKSIFEFTKLVTDEWNRRKKNEGFSRYLSIFCDRSERDIPRLRLKLNDIAFKSPVSEDHIEQMRSEFIDFLMNCAENWLSIATMKTPTYSRYAMCDIDTGRNKLFYSIMNDATTPGESSYKRLSHLSRLGSLKEYPTSAHLLEIRLRESSLHRKKHLSGLSSFYLNPSYKTECASWNDLTLASRIKWNEARHTHDALSCLVREFKQLFHSLSIGQRPAVSREPSCFEYCAREASSVTDAVQNRVGSRDA